MTPVQRVIKYLAIAFAVFLAVSIISGILSAAGLFGGLFDNNSVSDEIKTYSVSSNITDLSIEINSADLTIKTGDCFSVESNLKHLTMEEKNGFLNIKDSQKFNKAYNGAILTLYIPGETVFENAEITTGAGRFSAEFLSADSLKLKLGAGEVRIDTLIASKNASIEGGAGKITVSGGSLQSLDLKMGIGQLNLTSVLSEKCKFELGVGESNLNINGSKDDYKINIEKGIGSITVDGKSVSDFGNSGNNANSIDIKGGIGAINLNFKESDE